MTSNIMNTTHAINWLAQLPDRAVHLPSSLRIEFRIRVHADGHGYIVLLNQQTHAGVIEQPVNNVEEAVDLFRAVWEQAMILKAQAGTPESSEPEPTRNSQ